MKNEYFIIQKRRSELEQNLLFRLNWQRLYNNKNCLNKLNNNLCSSLDYPLRQFLHECLGEKMEWNFNGVELNPAQNTVRRRQKKKKTMTAIFLAHLPLICFPLHLTLSLFHTPAAWWFFVGSFRAKHSVKLTGNKLHSIAQPARIFLILLLVLVVAVNYLLLLL